jgi:hypothetical protein
MQEWTAVEELKMQNERSGTSGTGKKLTFE